jgi:hypothetical protein
MTYGLYQSWSSASIDDLQKGFSHEGDHTSYLKCRVVSPGLYIPALLFPKKSGVVHILAIESEAPPRIHIIIYESIHPSIHPVFTCSFVCLFVCLFVYLLLTNDLLICVLINLFIYLVSYPNSLASTPISPETCSPKEMSDLQQPPMCSCASYLSRSSNLS